MLLAGAMMAGLLLVPVVNLLTPLFGIALMVHVHKRLSGRALRRSRLARAASPGRNPEPGPVERAARSSGVAGAEIGFALHVELAGLAEPHQVGGAIASIAVGAMPMPSSVRPSAFASAETTLSRSKQRDLVAGQDEVVRHQPEGQESSVSVSTACQPAKRGDSASTSRRRSVTLRTYSTSSRRVRTSGPPSS